MLRKFLMCMTIAVMGIFTAGDVLADEPATKSAEGLLREKPPVIIIKLDDLKPDKNGGGVNGRWKAIANMLGTRKIKAGFGIICDTLPTANDDFVKWVKNLHDTGRVEFWFHGWDHQVHEENGTKYNEFNGRSLEEQKKRFADSQKLMLEKFGFPFESFGPGGGVYSASLNEDTLTALQDDPHMKSVMYPSPINAIGKALNAKGKVMVLDRVWAVNIEAPIFKPNAAKFIEGYKKSLNRDYFVIQGHPTHWGGKLDDEFGKILDFLESQNARFMTPTEYVNEVRKGQSAAAQ